MPPDQMKVLASQIISPDLLFRDSVAASPEVDLGLKQRPRSPEAGPRYNRLHKWLDTFKRRDEMKRA